MPGFLCAFPMELVYVYVAALAIAQRRFLLFGLEPAGIFLAGAARR